MKAAAKQVDGMGAALKNELMQVKSELASLRRDHEELRTEVVAIHGTRAKKCTFIIPMNVSSSSETKMLNRSTYICDIQQRITYLAGFSGLRSGPLTLQGSLPCPGASGVSGRIWGDLAPQPM